LIAKRCTEPRSTSVELEEWAIADGVEEARRDCVELGERGGAIDEARGGLVELGDWATA
jgi:hypothetical protein